MNLEQWIAVLTPAVSGIVGILASIIYFARKLKQKFGANDDSIKASLEKDKVVRDDIKIIQKEYAELNSKINYLIEQEKKRGKGNDKK